MKPAKSSNGPLSLCRDYSIENNKFSALTIHIAPTLVTSSPGANDAFSKAPSEHDSPSRFLYWETRKSNMFALPRFVFVMSPKSVK